MNIADKLRLKAIIESYRYYSITKDETYFVNFIKERSKQEDTQPERVFLRIIQNR